MEIVNYGRIRTGRAVLVAISIPIFTSQLEKSRDAVTVSNMRAAYAEASSAMLTANGKAVAKDGNVTVAAADTDGKVEVTVEEVVAKGYQLMVLQVILMLSFHLHIQALLIWVKLKLMDLIIQWYLPLQKMALVLQLQIK